MRARFQNDKAKRSGFTLIELVLAAGLLSILMVAVFGLIDGTLRIWRQSETRRNLTEQASGVLDLMAKDLRALDGGARGDILIEWASFDTDGDEIKESLWPRLRFVRQASQAELTRMSPPVAPEPAPEEESEEGGAKAAAPVAQAPVPASNEITGPGLIEVCWAIVPMSMQDSEARAEGLVFRGVRRVSDPSDSFFDPGFLKSNGQVRTEELDEVSGGILWLQPLMATQTSIVHESWDIGTEAPDAATSWDAWELDRPDMTIHGWNEPNDGMPKVKDRPLLPRRIRLELEFERPKDRMRRASTLTRIELSDVAFEVTDGRRMPSPGAHIKIDGEWMLVSTVRGERVTVKRGQRGTEIAIHDPQALVHWGLAIIREIPIALYQEDWNL
ncbi:MAG: prepilin-type N-terminal cleavage/methylation domain-containing protein [Planctomycetota bacterium]|jgi:prepilin-type N-terminal cleavage/methylation domain-containing protein